MCHKPPASQSLPGQGPVLGAEEMALEQLISLAVPLHCWHPAEQAQPLQAALLGRGIHRTCPAKCCPLLLHTSRCRAEAALMQFRKDALRKMPKAWLPAYRGRPYLLSYWDQTQVLKLQVPIQGL